MSIKLTSIGVKITSGPSDFTKSSPCSCDDFKSAAMILAPCFANLSTVPRPNPEAPPVTSATNPYKYSKNIISFYCHYYSSDMNSLCLSTYYLKLFLFTKRPLIMWKEHGHMIN